MNSYLSAKLLWALWVGSTRADYISAKVEQPHIVAYFERQEDCEFVQSKIAAEWERCIQSYYVK